MASEQSDTLRTALAGYFADNGFGADGGYGDAWVDFSLGPLPFPFPNTEGRKRAVRFHDLHHLITGYPTDTVGELTISAWEIGAGCGDFYAAWVINLSGLGLGALVGGRRGRPDGLERAVAVEHALLARVAFGDGAVGGDAAPAVVDAGVDAGRRGRGLAHGSGRKQDQPGQRVPSSPNQPALPLAHAFPGHTPYRCR